MIIEHQFLNQEWFMPNWKCNTLILGSFNPSGAQQVDYFYGRDRNKFWRAVATCAGLHVDHFRQGDLEDRLHQKIQCLQALGWGCSDIIREVKVVDAFVPNIIGNGYSDQSLFNVGNVSRTYNVAQILERLNHGDVKRVVIALGKRASPADYAEVKRALVQGCGDRNVQVYDDFVSFSARSRASVPELAKYLRQFIKV